jgi:hypothetical protein
MRHGGRRLGVPVGRVIAALLRGAGMACVILGASTPQAATLTVINNNDSGVGSLRAEVAAAASGDTINFAPGVTGTITLTSGEIDINTSLTITGPGAGTLTVSGNNTSIVFNVAIGGFTVAISGLTISGGNGSNGAGIFNGATMTLTDSVVSNNAAVGFGGGIFNFFSLTLNNSTVSGNSAATGAGIYSEGGLTVTNSVVSGNIATGNGGGIDDAGTMTLTNSTVSGNTGILGGGIYTNCECAPVVNSSTVSGNTAQFGGGIWTASGLSVINSTISGNAAGGGDGAGIEVNAATTTLNNVTIAGNGSGGEAQLSVVVGGGAAVTVESTIIANALGGGADCDGTAPTSNGFNLDSANSCAFGMSTDLINTNPLLGPLQNNGGPTSTMALLAGSPAIDKGSNPLALAFDQRGPGFARVVGVAADIGAFEVQGAPPSAAAPMPTLSGVALLALSALSALAGMAALRRRQRR